MVTPRTGRPRGRPPKDFLRDPERFAIPYALALMAVCRVSENDAFTIAAAEQLGTVTEQKSVGPRRSRGRGAVPPGILVSYERTYGLGGGTTANFAGKSATLRKKARKAKAAHPAWCHAMSRAFELALRPEKDQETSALEIMRLAISVGEGVYAHSFLLPRLSAEFFRAPD